jgi:hypothetical protein
MFRRAFRGDHDRTVAHAFDCCVATKVSLIYSSPESFDIELAL